MASVVAMASVLEDFDTRPSKKTCKDVDSPVVKTIKNYFSPVSKPSEKPFSPPRSNNIMDYFNRKASSPKTKTLSPSQSKENCQSGKPSTPPSVPKQPAAKRSKKASKAARKLVEATEDTSCVIMEEIDAISSAGVFGSDTAILLGQICNEASVSAPSSDQKGVESKKVKSDKLLNNIELSPILPPKDKSRKGKTTAANAKKRKQQEDQLSEPEVKETEKSLDDLSMEVNLGDNSQINNSTITISFEDFVRSQGSASSELCKETELVADQLQITDAEDSQKEPFLHISPRRVTIQAEVHAISPKEEGKTAAKVASIFIKEKGSSPVRAASPQSDSDLQVQPATSKWKSNVVLEENDVELCALESSSTPKCSKAERKQFMAAFKQPSFEGTKNKTTKNQGKQKQSEDKAEDDKVCEVETETQCTAAVQEKDTTASQSKEVKNKPAKKRQKKANVKKDTTLAPEEEADVTEVATRIGKKKEDQPTTSPSAPVVRRSKREAVVRQTANPTVTEFPQKPTRKQVSTDVFASEQEDLVALVTPKKHKPKHGFFKAEMTCPPDEMESPIRIRFSRVNRSKEANSSTTLVTKNSKESKKTKQAKKLLEKARARKQNKGSRDEKTLRRSSRTEASVKRSYCEDEDSIICVEESAVTTPQSVLEKGKSKAALRSLNDVLGKASSNKEAKTVLGSKVQDKAIRKLPPVSIFDDSSKEGSENSQDDEQFRARREFLKSGLPESFKKQMAKTAAVKEAYATACASFQPVLHISQPPNDCSYWNLPWPHSAFLHHLKETWCLFSTHPQGVNELINWKTQPSHRVLYEMVSCRRPEISAGPRESVMKEICSSNPAFPAPKFMNHFLKKQTNLTASEPSSVRKGISPEFSNEVTGVKRKRTEEKEETVKVAKKQRSTRSTETEPPKKERRSRRGAKSASQDSLQAAPPVQSKGVIVLDDSPVGPKPSEQDVFAEDVLWTDKYQPQHSSEVVGNTAQVRQLYSWLKEWKLRADKEDKKKLKDQKQGGGGIDSDWEGGEEDSRDADDMLCNTMLITGPSGIGKTAAVYACAQELGFKIFEVNASSQRNGRLILSQLKEATQSHQVDTQGVNAHKPTYFNSYSASSSAVRSSPRKVGSPRRAVSSPRKPPQSPRTTKRGGLAPTALANFFKMAKPGNKEQSNAKEKQSAVSKKGSNAVDKPNVLSKSVNAEEPSKKTATSLILFEEVDVIFEEDTGFLSAIKTFMTTTKRPVILTTSDPTFSAVFDGNFEEIVFRPPSVLNVASYLQLLCLAENVRTDLRDISSLLSLNCCDIRKTLLQLQFWTRSGGQRTAAPPSGQDEELQHKPEAAVTVMTDLDLLPMRETGCTESMLGLLNIAPHKNIWELLKRQEADFSDLVTMSRRVGLNLLYSNMETLLALPTTTLHMSHHKPLQCLPPSPDKPPVHLLQAQSLSLPARLKQNEDDFSDDTSPVKISNRMRKNRRKNCPPDHESLHSDSEDEFLSLKRQSAAQLKKSASPVPVKVIKKPLTCEERIQSVPVSQCLQSLADFLDDMSCMDFLSIEDTDVNRMYGVVLKDGLTDEARIETERRNLPMQGCALEIHSLVESLSFNKCSVSVNNAWHKVQQMDEMLREETTAQLTLPVASHNETCTFSQAGLCPSQVVQQRRRDIMDELSLKGAFGFVRNRPAAAQDYLPALRAICRSEQLKEQEKVRRRFLHYLDAIHLGLQKSTLDQLAEDFP